MTGDGTRTDPSLKQRRVCEKLPRYADNEIKNLRDSKQSAKHVETTTNVICVSKKGTNASIAAEAANVYATAREGHYSLADPYHIERPEGRDVRVPKLDTIKIFVIDPP